jgi:hypothetical protein
MSAGRFRAPGRQRVRRQDQLDRVRDRDDGAPRPQSESRRCPEQDRIPAGGFEGGVHRTDTDSLEATIRHENQPDSLPVFTVADTRRVLQDRPYAERTAEKILEYLMRVDEVRGVGRLYVP